MRKSTRQELDAFKRAVNIAVDGVHRRIDKIGLDKSDTRVQFLSDRHVNEAKFDALEKAYNEIVVILAVNDIVKPKCTECNQELPKDNHEG